jgi:hypothetical protein
MKQNGLHENKEHHWKSTGAFLKKLLYDPTVFKSQTCHNQEVKEHNTV